MVSVLWNPVAFLIALGILITVHEFDTFVARRCGVRVERFSIGFGRAVAPHRPWHRVRHRLDSARWLREDAGRARGVGGAGNAPSGLQQQNRLAARAIISAGPIANFLFAILAYWLVFIIGVPSFRPVIGEIAPQSIAAWPKFRLAWN